jgi:hypothetical protein
MMRIRPVFSTVARAGALLITAYFLIATSPPDRCGKWSAPVAFRVEGDCGPPGVVVVEADPYAGWLTIGNPQALGLPQLNANSGGSSTRASGRYDGLACPYTLEEGEWSVEVPVCGGGTAFDASTQDAAVGGGACVPPGKRICTADKEGSELWFTCKDPLGAMACRSRLTVLE